MFIRKTAQKTYSNRDMYFKLMNNSSNRVHKAVKTRAGIRYCKGIAWSIIIILLLSSVSCASNYKHRKIKSVPCPCENTRR